MPTGEIEIVVDGFYILSESKTPPFEITDECSANEQLRLEVEQMQNEILNLKNHRARWHQEPFLKEQLAREQLQLAYPGHLLTLRRLLYHQAELENLLAFTGCARLQVLAMNHPWPCRQVGGV